MVHRGYRPGGSSFIVLVVHAEDAVGIKRQALSYAQQQLISELGQLATLQNDIRNLMGGITIIDH